MNSEVSLMLGRLVLLALVLLVTLAYPSGAQAQRKDGVYATGYRGGFWLVQVGRGPLDDVTPDGEICLESSLGGELCKRLFFLGYDPDVEWAAWAAETPHLCGDWRVRYAVLDGRWAEVLPPYWYGFPCVYAPLFFNGGER